MSRSALRPAARALPSIGVVLLMRAHPVMAQHVPARQLGMMPMQTTESDLIRKLLPSVVTINLRKDVMRTEPGMNAVGTESSRRARGCNAPRHSPIR